MSTYRKARPSLVKWLAGDATGLALIFRWERSTELEQALFIEMPKRLTRFYVDPKTSLTIYPICVMYLGNIAQGADPSGTLRLRLRFSCQRLMEATRLRHVHLDSKWVCVAVGVYLVSLCYDHGLIPTARMAHESARMV